MFLPRQIGFWMEGAEGEFNFQVENVRAGTPESRRKVY